LLFVALAATSPAIAERRREPRTRKAMRAEIERLVEEIKQSVGLLRRHL
jgi:hypothetical protein